MYFGQDCSAARNLEVHTDFLHYCTFELEAANGAQNIRVDRAHEYIENDNVAAYIIKSLQLSEDTNNSVYKLIMDKQQLVLINVLNESIFEH